MTVGVCTLALTCREGFTSFTEYLYEYPAVLGHSLGGLTWQLLPEGSCQVLNQVLVGRGPVDGFNGQFTVTWDIAKFASEGITSSLHLGSKCFGFLFG